MASVLFYLLMGPTWAADPPAANNSAEQLGKQLESGRTNGRVLWLDAAAGKTFAVAEEPSGRDIQGAIILLHDLGSHGDSAQFIAPLRTTLTRYGWMVLSVHVPALFEARLAPVAELTKHVQEILAAATTLLNQRGVGTIVVVAHGVSAPLAAAALAANAGNVKALIALSAQIPKSPDPALNLSATYSALTLPMLDIYGERDFPQTIEQASLRAAAKRPAKPADETKFRQTMIPGADHDYRGQEDLLSRRIVGWLRKILPPTEKR